MTLLYMIIVSLIWLASLLPAGGIWFMTLMMTDSGMSDRLEYILVVSLIALSTLYFVVTIGVIIFGWIAYLANQPDLAAYILAVPLVHITLFIILFVLIIKRPSSD